MLFGVLLGALLGASGTPWGHIGVTLGYLGTPLGPFLVTLGPLGHHFGGHGLLLCASEAQFSENLLLFRHFLLFLLLLLRLLLLPLLLLLFLLLLLLLLLGAILATIFKKQMRQRDISLLACLCFPVPCYPGLKAKGALKAWQGQCFRAFH